MVAAATFCHTIQRKVARLQRAGEVTGKATLLFIGRRLHTFMNYTAFHCQMHIYGPP